MSIAVTEKIDEIGRLIKEVREYKAAHPETVTGYYLNNYASLLNAYREGDLGFEECVTLLGRVDVSKRISHDSICDDIDLILPLVKELTAYQALVYVALYRHDIPDPESAIKLVAKYARLIADHERRRFEPAATARAIVEQEASQPAAPSKESEARAREIIEHISDAAIELAFVRHSLTNDTIDDDEGDIQSTVDAEEKLCHEVKDDILDCLTGDDTGCLDPEDLDETNCELLWLQKILAGMGTDAARFDWLESFIQTGVIEAGFEMDGGVHLTLSKLGEPEPTAFRGKNSLRDAVDEAMKES